MRTLRWLGIFCALWVLIFYAAGIAEWDMGVELSMLAFFLCLFAAFLCANLLFIQELRRKYFWPRDWEEAVKEYPAPKRPQGDPLGRNQTCLRLGNGRTLVPICAISTQEGLVLGDRLQLFSLGRICVPWRVLHSPKSVRLPWYFAWFRRGIESRLDGLSFSIVAAEDAWERGIAPWLDAEVLRGLGQGETLTESS